MKTNEPRTSVTEDKLIAAWGEYTGRAMFAALQNRSHP